MAKFKRLSRALAHNHFGQKSRDSQSPHAQNVLVPKKVITALQAAQLLPTD